MGRRQHNDGDYDESNNPKGQRASSVAFDRLLSTLLVEIDGIGMVTGPSYLSRQVTQASYTLLTRSNEKVGLDNVAVNMNSSKAAPVIVIATVSDSARLDRCVF